MSLYLLHCAGRLFIKLAPTREAALAFGRAHFNSSAVDAVKER